MGKATHTPEPWDAHYLPQHRMRITARNGDVSICDIALWNVDYVEQMANAALIAAAPDLVKALEAFIAAHDDWERSTQGIELDDPLTDAAATARAAIARAKGETDNG